MSVPFSAVAGVQVRVGYVSQNTAKILVASLRGGTVSATCSGGTVVLPTLVGYGDDNPAQVGKYVCATGVLLITGLSPFTLYTFSVTVDGQTIEGSFTTAPADDATDYAFMQWTCECTIPGRNLKEDGWARMKELVEASDVPVIFAAHIDDMLYADIFKFILPNQTDTETGLYITAGTGQQGPCATGLMWDYAVAWCGWLGLLASIPHLTTPGRYWFMRNMPLWCMWGDHEIEGDHCQITYDGLGASSVSRGCNRAAYWIAAEPATENLEAKAETIYNAFCADAMTPPRQAADGGPATQANAQYWGTVIGPVRFFAFDRNKYSLPYNACDAGDTHSYGRGNFIGTCSGATIPTRTQLGIGTDTAPTDFLGQTQLDDMLAWLDNDEPFKVIFASNGISRHNQPWGDMYPAEFDQYIGQATAPLGLMKNPKTNGTDGYSVHLKGDTHGMNVVSYHADGTSGGLGSTGTSSGELWEICPGTVNGSTIGGNLFGGTIHSGGKLRSNLCGKVQGDITLAAIVFAKVYASLPAKRLDISMVQVPSKTILWRGFQEDGQAGNLFQYDTTRRVG